MTTISKSVPMDAIAVYDRLSQWTPDTKLAIDALARDMRRNGLINPVSLMEDDDGGYFIVAGFKRFCAAKLLKWKSIPARIFEGSEDVAMSIEVSENLCRQQLSPIDRAIFADAALKLHRRTDPEATETEFVHAQKNSSVARVISNALKTAGIGGYQTLRGTSLDKAVELESLAKLEKINPPVAADLKARAVAGDQVSAKRAMTARHAPTRGEALAAAKREFEDLKKAAAAWLGRAAHFPEIGIMATASVENLLRALV